MKFSKQKTAYEMTPDSQNFVPTSGGRFNRRKETVFFYSPKTSVTASLQILTALSISFFFIFRGGLK